MKKKMGVIISCLVFSLMLFISDGVYASSLQKETEVNCSEGLVKTEVIEILPDEIDRNAICDAEQKAYISSNKGAAPGKEWEKYGSYYYYNQLTTTEKKFYDKLNTLCLTYLTTKDNAFKYDEKRAYLNLITTEGLSVSRAQEIMEIFRMSNPQYFFLNATIWTSTQYQRVGFGIYKIFEKGSTRMQAKELIENQLRQWEDKISQATTDEAKVKVIHDLIVNKVNYAYDFDYTDSIEDEKYMSQCIYSVFCMDETVCAGYAQSFSMLCNGAGIDSVSVTSSTHQWNKVRIEDSWYNMDCTWNDTYGDERVKKDDEIKYIYSNKPSYLWFIRSDKKIDELDDGSHVETKVWSKYLPKCTLDSNSKEYTAGTLKKITDSTAIPVISVSTSGGKSQVTITSSTKNAKIYYSTNGAVPAPAYVKCSLYSGTFTVEKGKSIKAIAVCDGKFDSGYSMVKCVSFNGNKATSGYVNDVYYTTAKDVVIPKNGYVKKGYTFTGWNTKADGTGTAYSPNQILTADILEKNTVVKIYAQWKPIVYKITYKTKGGKNDSKNPSTYMVTDKIKLKSPVKKGYTFKGWYTDKKCKKKLSTIKAGTTGNITLYAKWQVNKYTIVFKGNRSTEGKMSSLKARKYGVSYKLPANKFKRAGYKFKGWSTKKNGKGKIYKNKQKVKNLSSRAGKKVILYAVWKKVK